MLVTLLIVIAILWFVAVLLVYFACFISSYTERQMEELKRTQMGKSQKFD